MEKIKYNNAREYYKNKYGERVLKICIDGGFTCPNRDGTKGYGGCIFCGERGSGEKLKAINVIKEALSKIKLTEDIVIGLPDAFYEIKENGVLIPYCEWAFANKDEYLSELKNNTMFDDADIENLIIFNEEIEKTLQKTKDNN